MTAYAPLTEGLGFLTSYKDQGRSEWLRQAEREANAEIDTRLQEWDRSAWQHGNVPPDVQRAAEYIGVSEYILLSTTSTNPGVEQVPVLVTDFRSRGNDILSGILSSGFVRMQDGSIVHTKTAEQPSGGSSARLYR